MTLQPRISEKLLRSDVVVSSSPIPDLLFDLLKAAVVNRMALNNAVVLFAWADNRVSQFRVSAG